MRQDWFSRLYENEIKNLKIKLKTLNTELENDKSELSDSRKGIIKFISLVYQSLIQMTLQTTEKPK